MQFRLLLLLILVFTIGLGCASSINTVYKARSMSDDDPYAQITVYGTSSTISHVYTPQGHDGVKVDPIVAKDSPSMEALKLAYNFTPWGLLTRAFDATSTGVYRVPPGRLVLQIFRGKQLPLVARQATEPQAVKIGYYAFVSATLEEGENYDLESGEQWGTPPVLTGDSPDIRALSPVEVYGLLTGDAEDEVPDNQTIMDAGARRAGELEADFLALIIDPDKGLVLPPGSTFRLHNGQFALYEGQLVANLGYTPMIFGEALVLSRGECALVVHNGLVKKEPLIESAVGLQIAAPSAAGSFSRVVQHVFFGN